MKILKKIALMAATLAFGTAVGATIGHADSVKSELKTPDTLTIGLEGTYAPFSYRKDGKLQGFEVEIGKAVAKEMGLKAKFVPTKWDSLIAGLGAKKFDVVMNNIAQTPERQKKYLFSDPYISSHFVLIVKKDSSLKNLKSIKGHKMAAGVGTNNATLVKKFGGTTVDSSDFTSSLDMVKQGRVDGMINSREAWYVYAKKHSTKGLKMIDVSDEAKPVKVSAMFNKKSTALQKQYNKALEKLQKDGTVKKLSQKYFGADITK
ncbi:MULTISPECIES: transporter substrate-binding domain-containing protein [Limosilactobacillus]|uniref:transporter substrate-binding domain-containing protein n=1 Tax=Limosilactobacillus TaxID=2742598 RepID=UPI0024BA2C33|nr:MULTISPECIES: transporter substrate-binding domain-containing protein [Limosilactobacillus]MDM8220125.1 transporter substrate-binding domain-containing protein [Limosilactobacillus mucosae]MDM8314807.1 transporter substrate-binding domain-containing protein [Limosilactobacillus mucosae]